MKPTCQHPAANPAPTFAALTATAATLLLGAASLGAARPDPPELKEEWTLDGFKNPESALYDAENDIIYVSNVNGAGTAKDDNGFISKVSPEGRVTKLRWATGLDAPKGLALHGTTLYVSDIDQLVAVSTKSGKVLKKYPAEGAQFLNDVAADEAGLVYVSDMPRNVIYRLRRGDLKPWLESDKLENPNGLLAEGEHLVIGSWGRIVGPGFNTSRGGHLKTVDLESKRVKSLGDESPVGNLDGVEPDGQGNYFVTDWIAGRLFLIEPSGRATKLLQGRKGTADIGLIPEKKLLLLPQMLESTLTAYRVEGK